MILNVYLICPIRSSYYSSLRFLNVSMNICELCMADIDTADSYFVIRVSDSSTDFLVVVYREEFIDVNRELSKSLQEQSLFVQEQSP